MSQIYLARDYIQGSLISLGFITLDVICLKSLPKLDMSFGTEFTSIFILSFFRTLIFAGWLILGRALSLGLSIWLKPSIPPWIFIVIPNLLVFGLVIYAFCIEPFQLTVSRIEVPVPGLKQTQRIVQLSDLHVEFTTRREQELSTLVESLHPDMIVLTGDYVNESYINEPRTYVDLRELLGHLKAHLGIYAVNGNVEDPLWLRKTFSTLKIRVLDDEIDYIPEFGDNTVLVGLSFRNWIDDNMTLQRLMGNLQPGDFSILLYHKPDLAYTAHDTGVDLYLTGHTHGGQVRLPFYGALFSNSKFGKTFEMGLYQLGGTTMYVNRGLGFTGGDAPRARFLCPPEVVVIDLIPSEGN